MEPAHQPMTRTLATQWMGRFLYSTGVMVVLLLGLRLVREEMDRRMLMNSTYLLIPQTPVFHLPAATALPSTTPTPLPSSTPAPTASPTPTPLPTLTISPQPFPAIRISIPAIRLNAGISEISPTRKVVAGKENYVWEVPSQVAGHLDTSGRPGEGTNIVLIGHNNMSGKVFRDLDKLNPGDEIILFTEASEFYYQVQKELYIPYLGMEAEGDAALQSYAAPLSTETLTLISCWPYVTNANRIVIIAIPLSKGSANGE
jgi:sortase A